MTVERVFSGIQPSGEIHIGNYLGAVKKWVQLCDEYECIYCVVDDHAITVDYDPRRLPTVTLDAVTATMACGLDPDKCAIFVQSHVPEHTELTWLFDTVTPLGSLFRMTQFKDKARNALQRRLAKNEGGARKTALHQLKSVGLDAVAKIREFGALVEGLDPEAEGDAGFEEELARTAAVINDGMGAVMQRLQVGLGVADASTALLSYPVLQAADILLYKAALVPVGEDQEQHLELCREIAERFNKRFGDVFPMARRVRGEAPKILGLDGKQKMSKSLGNHIGVLDTEEEIRNKLKGAFTDPARVRKSDPGHPEICNVFSLHGFFTDEQKREELAEGCRGGKIGCFECKKVLTDGIEGTLGPIRDRARELRDNPRIVVDALEAGRIRCSGIARETMEEVRDAMGLGSRVLTRLV